MPSARWVVQALGAWVLARERRLCDRRSACLVTTFVLCLGFLQTTSGPFEGTLLPALQSLLACCLPKCTPFLQQLQMLTPNLIHFQAGQPWQEACSLRSPLFPSAVSLEAWQCGMPSCPWLSSPGYSVTVTRCRVSGGGQRGLKGNRAKAGPGPRRRAVFVLHLLGLVGLLQGLEASQPCSEE